ALYSFSVLLGIGKHDRIRTAPHLAALMAETPGMVSVGDGATVLSWPVPYVRVDEDGLASGAGASTVAPAMPMIPSEQCVARVYTSGSTGQPQGFDKHFGCLRRSIEAAMQRIWPVTQGPCSVVGTSSFRHMFGFEATVLLPLWGGGQLSERMPFFPADVCAALAAMSEPRLLVTTPYHLRKLLEADVALPRVAAVLSATAPLALEWAQRAEAVLGAPVLELYGATELGMTATRQPCRQDEWDTLGGLTLQAQGDEAVVAQGPSLAQPQALHDVIELLSPTRFRLIDRSANLINIVGKRSSLGFLNHLLCDIPGVHDGVFCLPQTHDAARLAAFVVAPGLRGTDILAALRPHLDPVFLPRPIVFLDHLPRDANGKLPAASLRALIGAHLT
ncbi:MAG: AMP-binding protein, partial [Aquabacterium sp.]